MNILHVLGDSRWEQFRYVRMSLFSQTGAPLLDHQAFNSAALVKRFGRTKYSPKVTKLLYAYICIFCCNSGVK